MLGRLRRVSASGRRLARGAAWVGLIQVVATASGFVTALVFAWTLAPAEYGEYNFVMAISSLAGMFGLPGMFMAVSQAVAAGERVLRPAARATLLAALLGSAALLLAVPLASAVGMDGRAIGPSLVLAAVVCPFAAVGRLYLGVLSGRQAIGQLTVVASAVTVLTSTTLVAVALLDGSAGDLVAVSVALPGLATFLITAYYVARETPSEGASSSRDFGIRLSLAQIPSAVTMYADRLIVGASVGLADLGVYSYAQVVPEQARGFAKGLNWLFVPELTRMSDDAVRRMFAKRMWQFTATVAAGVLAYIAVAPLLYQTLFPAFAAAAPYSQLLALALLALPSTLSVSVLQARKVSGGLIKADTLNAVINVGLLWLLVPGLGLWGAVAARVAGRVAAHLLLLVLVRRYLGGRRQPRGGDGPLPSVDAPAKDERQLLT